MAPTQESLIARVIAVGVRDPLVLRALRQVPRAEFVPPELAGHAYVDQPLPIAHGQVTTQPSLVARMVEALGLSGRGRVLEVGTGTGYQTAVLARLADFVWSVERWEDLAEAARENLRRHGTRNVEVVVGDGTEGLKEHAPYDAIIVAAAHPEVPPPLAEQLATGGALVQPIGPGGDEDVVLFEKEPEGLVRRRVVSGASFVKLYGAHGFTE